MTQKKWLIIHIRLVGKNHQFRHLMLCLKVANNVTNNYCSCQSLYDSIQLSLINITKEPKWSLNNKRDLTNNCKRVKKKRNCLDCKRFLYLEITGHRVSSKNCHLFINKMRFATIVEYYSSNMMILLIMIFLSRSRQYSSTTRKWLNEYMKNVNNNKEKYDSTSGRYQINIKLVDKKLQ